MKKGKNMIPLLFPIMLQLLNPTNGFGTNPIINGSYYNISTASGFYSTTNNSTDGFEELFIMIILFFILTFASIAGGKFSPPNAILGASIIMIIISTIAQSVFAVSNGVAMAAFLPLLFVALTILSAMWSMLQGFGGTYNT